MRVVVTHEGAEVLAVAVPGDLLPETPVSELLERVEAQVVDQAMGGASSLALQESAKHTAIAADTAVGFLHSLADAEGTVTLEVVAKEEEERRSTTASTSSLHDALSGYTRPQQELVAVLPGLAVDPSAAIVVGDAVNILSVKLDALLTVIDGSVVQSVPVANVPQGDMAVSCQGNKFHILAFKNTAEEKSVTLFGLTCQNGVQWTPTDLEVSGDAMNALAGATSTVCGSDGRDGSVVVATRSEGTQYILRLNTSSSPASLGVECQLAAGSKVEKCISAFESEAVFSDITGTEAASSVLIITGRQQTSRIHGSKVSPYEGGSLFLADGALHAAVCN
ncbi:hypothetical protein KIPB_011171, partial [Kipferlia bialata]|eukprot:g11171.t1